MTYDSRAPAQTGILFSYATTPWGPWSAPQVLFNAQRDGALGKFIHDPGIRPDDGLAGPVIGRGQKKPVRSARRGLRAVPDRAVDPDSPQRQRRPGARSVLRPVDLESVRCGADEFASTDRSACGLDRTAAARRIALTAPNERLLKLRSLPPYWADASGEPSRVRSGDRGLVSRKDEEQLFLALRARQLAAPAAADECKRNGGRGQHQEQADRIEYRGRPLAHASIHHDRKRRVRTDQHERRVEVLE